MTVNSQIKIASKQIIDLFFDSSDDAISMVLKLQGQAVCNRRKVAAVLLRNRITIEAHHNGPIYSDFNNCKRCFIDKNHQSCTPCAFEHAEARCCHSAKLGDTLLTSTSPCIQCAKLIIGSGISTIFFLDEYSDITPLNLLLLNNVFVYRIKR